MYQQRLHLLALWKPIGLLILLLALSEFLHDVFRPDWPAWLMPPLLTIGFVASISLAKRDEMAKHALWMAALAVLAFVLIYDVIDFLLDPFVKSDLAVGVLAALIMAGLWQLLAGIVAVEEV
jgi:uncharacterized BrkB/YihY/UPF0761 family membrane protein